VTEGEEEVDDAWGLPINEVERGYLVQKTIYVSRPATGPEVARDI